MAMDNPGISDWVSWWNLGESGGAKDLHGLNNLSETGGTIESAAGLIGNASDFELGDTERYEIASNASLHTANLPGTWGIWGKTESLPASMCIMGKTLDSAGHREWRLYIESQRYRINVSANGTTEKGVSAVTGSSVITNGVWHLAMWSHNPADDRIRISVDAGAEDSVSVDATGLYQSDAAFTIGSQANNTLYYDGLGCLAFFCRKLLTADQRAWMFNGGLGRSYYELGGAGGIIIL